MSANPHAGPDSHSHSHPHALGCGGSDIHSEAHGLSLRRQSQTCSPEPAEPLSPLSPFLPHSFQHWSPKTNIAKMEESSYFENNLYPNPADYLHLESEPPDPLPPMLSFSSEHVDPSDHPMFVDESTGSWEHQGLGADQFGILPQEDPLPLFEPPELCVRTRGNDRRRENDDIRPSMQLMADGTYSPPSTRRASTSNLSEARSSKSSMTDITPPDQSQPKKRKTTKKKGQVEGPDEQKRNKFLERNRIAASKCREKKKSYMSDLEQQKFALETKNTDLHRTAKDLKREVDRLKHEMLAHAKCNDPKIDSWIEASAGQFVKRTPSALLGSLRVPPRELMQGYYGQNPPGPPALPPGYQAHPGLSVGPYSPLGVGDGQNRLFDPIDLADGQSRPFDHMVERQSSFAYSHVMAWLAPSMYAESTPVDPMFPPNTSPPPKREPSMNYDHMPEDMFERDPPLYASA
ncbi:hypothetical protein QBC39DRAFT_378547 [Podospora conica]|nr:hypothetical protein QBC39DRAFT_378547 [Schizothecium conicum]